MEFITNNLGGLIDGLLAWAPKLIGAILVLIIGLWIVNKLVDMMGKAMAKSGLDTDLIPFLTSMSFRSIDLII